ncbi:AAA family ATPase [Edwardsiella tarda]|uniref:AAA family ATPase n=1 Tax=Edwardsiella tarda TaxID=636 RepID=UPI002444D84A|nr:AAA family ATPase [Edwardsiella tarda]WGE27692.1 AAA family ATPase [Edwardsiella tarda]
MDYYYSETSRITKYPGIHLHQDHIGTNYKVPWDDFGYIITFQAYYVKNNTKIKIGNVKILAKDCENTSVYFKENGESIEPKIIKINRLLSEEKLVSIGKDMIYYKNINSLFNQREEDVDYLLESLCDAGYFYRNHDKYSKWGGYSDSLLREGGATVLLKKGYSIALGNYSPRKEFNLLVDGLGNKFDPVSFKFNVNGKIGRSDVCLLIGKNGVGKTHILKRISEIISGTSTDKCAHPYFHKLIVIAYSPFDSFYTENEMFSKIVKKHSHGEVVNNKKSDKRKRLHVNAYSYVGFRDQDGNFDLKYPVIKSVESVINIIKYDYENMCLADKTKLEVLIETLSASISFDSISIFNDKGEEIFLTGNIKPSSLKTKIDFSKGLVFRKNSEIIPLSSGQKIYTYMIPAIISELEDESLLVIDEPELYLHPELEVELINMLKNILKEMNSFAIIATHSAILTREVERESVTILRKNNGKTSSFSSSIETYGESVDAIIAEVFDDGYTIKSYQREIDRYLNEKKSIHDIKGCVGDDALAYALSKSLNDGYFDFEDEK